MLYDSLSVFMPIRLGQFYACLLLFTCLGINIAFFSEVREPFLGGADPLASVKSALSELDIKARIAEFYPQTLSKAENIQKEDVQNMPLPTPKKQEKPSELSASMPKPEPVVSNPVLDPFLLPSQPPKEMPKEEETKLKKSEIPNPIPSVIVPEESNLNQQTAVTVPAPKPAAAKPMVADQFKPIMTQPKPVEPVKPSANVVWDTIDTALERPIRYDQ